MNNMKSDELSKKMDNLQEIIASICKEVGVNTKKPRAKKSGSKDMRSASNKSSFEGEEGEAEKDEPLDGGEEGEAEKEEPKNEDDY